MDLKDFIKAALEEYMISFTEAELDTYKEQQIICNEILSKIDQQLPIRGVHLETLSQAVLEKAEQLEKGDPFVSETLLEYLEQLEGA